MKKLKAVVVLLIALVLAVIVVAFLIHMKQSKVKESINKDFNIAVIETTGQENESYLTVYNKDLIKTGTQEIKLGSMGSSFDLPRICGKNMYVIPQGVGNAKDLSVVIEYNMETGKYKTYDMKQPCMNSFSVSEKSIYTVNTLNFNSIISCYDKSSNNVKTISIDRVYIGHIDLYDDTLYAFGTIKCDDGTLKSYLYLIDTKGFKLTDTIDISKSGLDQYSSIKIGDDIYFTSQNEMSDFKEQGSYNLNKFNIKDKTISNIKLKENYPFQIINYNDKLIISHYNLVKDEGNKITIYDPKSNEQQVVTLENVLSQILIKDDKLYSMDRENLYVYSINNTELKLVNKVDIHTKRKSDTFFYLSSFFTK